MNDIEAVFKFRFGYSKFFTVIPKFYVRHVMPLIILIQKSIFVDLDLKKSNIKNSKSPSSIHIMRPSHVGVSTFGIRCTVTDKFVVVLKSSAAVLRCRR